MSKGQRIITVALWAVLVVVMLGVIAAGAWDRLHDAKEARRAEELAKKEEGLPVLWSAPTFSLTDQDGKPFTNANLGGHPWVAAFIFTHCAGPCPMITGKMAALQKALKNPGIQFVSFTVDPENDTPDVLKGYAKTFLADTSRWHFLTGTAAEMDRVAAEMKVAAMPATGSKPIFHGTELLLMDAEGRIRGIYHGQSDDPAEMQRLAHDAETLAGSKPQ